ncbi:MAG: hypothetical protein RJA34_1747 [Pseudomonadota bacterium]
MLASVGYASGANFRKRYKLLQDFAAGQFDPRITFTRASSATHSNAAGAVVTVASNAPRLDYDPATLLPRGFLVEEARTNLLTYSEQFDNAAWTKSNATVTVNAVTALDGLTTADKLVEAATTSTHYLQQIFSATNATAYTGSFFAKAGERTKIAVWFSGAFSFVSGYFDLSTGTKISGTGEIVSVGGGWFRISYSNTATSTASSAFIITVCDATGNATYTGNGTSGIYIWGAQLEAGSLPTSYISTTSAQVTRAADVATMTGTNFSDWYNQTAFSMVVRFTGNASGTRSYFAISDGTINERIELQSVGGTLTLTVVDGGVTQAALALGSVVTGTTYAVAIAWAANDFAASVNGGAVVTDGAGTLPTVNQMSIGMGYASGNVQCAYSRIFTGYPTRLSNAQLQALTA